LATKPFQPGDQTESIGGESSNKTAGIGIT